MAANPLNRSGTLGPWALVLLLLGMLGCLVLLDFYPEGTPCTVEGACPPDYVCNAERHCTKDGGVTATCSSCPQGSACVRDAGACARVTCDDKLCGAGEKCVNISSGATCQPRDLGT